MFLDRITRYSQWLEASLLRLSAIFIYEQAYAIAFTIAVFGVAITFAFHV